MTIDYDLCFAWNWPYDCDFAEMLAMACQRNEVSLLQVTPENLQNVLNDLSNHELSFRAFFDRASDADESFIPLVQWARQADIFRVNPFRLARRAWDKAFMHQQFTQSGLGAPQSIVIPSFEEQPDLNPIDLSILGDHFAIKPVHGGGGVGVIACASSWQQVQAAREQFPSDQYLLQAYVVPAVLGQSLAWFRLIYCTGKVYPFWWDPYTHIYSALTWSEQCRFGLHTLRYIPAKMAEICQLELFSTEIAYTLQDEFLIVDYINDPIDLRLQSKVPEGVPDEFVARIADELADYVAVRCQADPLYAF